MLKLPLLINTDQVMLVKSLHKHKEASENELLRCSDYNANYISRKKNYSVGSKMSDVNLILWNKVMP